MRPYSPPWHHGSTKVETRNNGRDVIEKLPDGRFIAFLSNGDFVHGPLVSAVDARECCNSRCDCWKPSVKADQSVARRLLCLAQE